MNLKSVLFFITVLSAGIAHAEAKLINGAGATFPYPIYTKWFSEFKTVSPQYNMNYQSIGSGGGIRQLLDSTVQFGASDAPMTDDMMKTSKNGPILHIPTVLGAVVVTYNLPDVKEPLRMTAEIIAAIYQGKITKWNDAKIAKENSKLKLPDLAILPVYRSDGSGTTAVFTDYLSKATAGWKTEVGVGNAVKWPTGLGGKGNEGVTGVVKQTKGAVGYVELIFAKTNNLPAALIKNKAGEFVEASAESVTSAAEAAVKSMPEDFRTSITDEVGKKTYPISSYTYILVYKDMPKDTGTGIVDFLKWAMGPGQKMTASMHYAPLPSVVNKKVLESLKTINLK